MTVRAPRRRQTARASARVRAAGGLWGRERRALIETLRWLMAERLYTGTSGNVSCRAGDGFLVTPSGLSCEEVGPADLVEVGLDGESRGRWQASSEWRIHRDLYRARPEIGAVVHAHSTFATALACLRRSVPAFHYMIAKTGGPELRCATYATYGTEALSRNALAALAGRQACLLANHGLVAVGPDLGAARRLAGEVELLSAQYLFARVAGKPVVLSAREMAVVANKFAGYGPRRTGGRG